MTTTTTTSTEARDLLAVALVGAQRVGSTLPATGSPVDQLALAGAEGERALLLRAGAWATYRRAGYLPSPAPEAPIPAHEETRPICPPGANALFSAMLSDRDDVLEEALERLNTAGWRLPPSLLPLALSRTPATLRATLAPALGARGRWLARQNPAWSWVAQTLEETPAEAPDDVDALLRLWEEGALNQRVSALLQLRQSDPARARELLAAAWKREKAEARVRLLAALATNLAPEDEPLLVFALADRAEQVRAVAADLLFHLPTSAFAQRAHLRAERALIYANGALDGVPPSADDDWMRDMPLKTTPALILTRALQCTPPDHWEALYGATPAELIAAICDAHWRNAILRGWTEATVRFGSKRWALPLWQAWLDDDRRESIEEMPQFDSNAEELAPLLPASELESLALRLLTQPAAPAKISLHRALALLPRPWSGTVASAYLDSLRAFVAGLTPTSNDAEPWQSVLHTAALALPTSHFAQALEPFILPEKTLWQITAFGRSLERFGATIDLRARIVKELPL